MNANQLTNGQFFKLIYRGQPSKYDETDVLECVDENRPADWMKYPGIVYRNTRTGLHGGLGGANEIVLCDDPAPAEKMTVVREWQSMDISSGLGIGGAGSDDFNIHTETDSFVPQFSKRKSSGQLWQPCNRRGCDNEPVCLDCEYCDDHCRCGE